MKQRNKATFIARTAMALIMSLGSNFHAEAQVEKGTRPAVTPRNQVTPFDELYFENGYAAIERDGKWGIVNEKQEIVVPIEWDQVGSFSEGLAAVKKNDRWGYADTTGVVVIQPTFFMADRFESGLAAVQPEPRGKYGFIDKTGAMVIPAQWVWAGGFSDILAPVMDGEYGFIDRTGRVVIPLQYDSAGWFIEGKAEVEKDGRVFFINIRGEELDPNEKPSILGKDIKDSLSSPGKKISAQFYVESWQTRYKRDGGRHL